MIITLLIIIALAVLFGKEVAIGIIGAGLLIAFYLAIAAAILFAGILAFGFVFG